MQPTGHQLTVCLAAVMPRDHSKGELSLVRGVDNEVSVFHDWTGMDEEAVVCWRGLQ